MRTSAARSGLALILGALTAFGYAPSTASATQAPGLRIVSVDRGGGPDTRLLVVVPPELARRDVPASAFRVSRSGRNVPTAVRPVADADLDVHIVLDTAVPAATFAAEQSAAADLLRNLPPEVRTATARSDGGALSVHVAQPGNEAALRTLAEVMPQMTTSLHGTLNTIASIPVVNRTRVVVLLTDCGVRRVGDLAPFLAALSASNQQLHVVAPGPGCPSQLSSLARRDGGLAMTGGSLARIDEALDTVLFDLIGQYEISVPTEASQGPLTVSVDYDGVRVTTEVGGSEESPLAGREAGSMALLAGLATLAALILGSTLLMVLHTGIRGRALAS